MTKEDKKKYESIRTKIMASTYGLYATEEFGFLITLVDKLESKIEVQEYEIEKLNEVLDTQAGDGKDGEDLL